MDTTYLGPFSAKDIDTIHRAMKDKLENLEDYLDHGIELTVDVAVPFLEEQTRLGRIIDRIEHIRLAL